MAQGIESPQGGTIAGAGAGTSSASGRPRSKRRGTTQPGEESRLALILKSTLPPLVIVLLLLVAWQVGSETGALPGYIFRRRPTSFRRSSNSPGCSGKTPKRR